MSGAHPRLQTVQVVAIVASEILPVVHMLCKQILSSSPISDC
jgi:hypothetical protein